MGPSTLLAVGEPTIQLMSGFDVPAVLTTAAPLALGAMMGIAGVKLSVSWFSAVVRKLSGAGRRI